MERLDLRIRTRVGTMNRAGPFSPLTPALSPLRGEGDMNSLPLRPLGGEGRGEVGTFNSRFMGSGHLRFSTSVATMNRGMSNCELRMSKWRQFGIRNSTFEIWAGSWSMPLGIWNSFSVSFHLVSGRSCTAPRQCYSFLAHATSKSPAPYTVCPSLSVKIGSLQFSNSLS
jgi:hypothetical protein